MGAYRYCHKCEAGMSAPTPRQVVDPDEYCCQVCGSQNTHHESKDELILSLVDRIEALEAALGHKGGVVGLSPGDVPQILPGRMVVTAEAVDRMNEGAVVVTANAVPTARDKEITAFRFSGLNVAVLHDIVNPHLWVGEKPYG